MSARGRPSGEMSPAKEDGSGGKSLPGKTLRLLLGDRLELSSLCRHLDL